MAAADSPIVFPAEVRERLLATIYERLPLKSFGYLISSGDPCRVDDFVLFEGNTRNSEEWKGRFQAYGQYFLEHDDAGFVSTPEETWRVQKELWRRGMTEVGIFHSHLRHPANFSGIDFDMHTSRYLHLWHMIVAVRNRAMPQVRVFDVTVDAVREQDVTGENELFDAPLLLDPEVLFALDAEGKPRNEHARGIFEAIPRLSEAEYDRLVTRGLLAGFEERYRRYVEPAMRRIPAGRFVMGTPAEEQRHFVGESPAHSVEVAPFAMGTVTVTNELLGLMDARRLAGKDDLQKPAVGVSWYEARLFAMWMGCRLPTEAEWEYACGAGSDGEWACAPDLLPEMAWFSENSHGVVQDVGRLRANAFGLHDLHGNVWEWCEDRYGQDAYDGISPRTADRVCRGGSVDSLAEMCRTRYRLHEPPEFSASDLGFRLVKGGV